MLLIETNNPRNCFLIPMTEEIKKAKRLFMTYRNGIVADSLRKAGMPYSIIFGLQLPQVRQIARQFEDEVTDRKVLRELAGDLWADAGIRESRMLALALYPAELLTLEEAVKMMNDLQTREEADLLPFLLLKKTTFIPEIISRIVPENELDSYKIEALSRYV